MSFAVFSVKDKLEGAKEDRCDGDIGEGDAMTDEECASGKMFFDCSKSAQKAVTRFSVQLNRINE